MADERAKARKQAERKRAGKESAKGAVSKSAKKSKPKTQPGKKSPGGKKATLPKTLLLLLERISSGKQTSSSELDLHLKHPARIKLIFDAFKKREKLIRTRLKDEAVREDQYRTLQANIPVGLFRSTPSGKLLSANPALIRMMGYESEADFLAVPVASTYVDPQRRKEFIKFLTSKGSISSFTAQMKRKDGKNIWVSISATAVKDRDGKVHYDGIIEDITERRKTEQALYESEELYRTLVDTAQDAIIQADPEERIIFANPAASKLLGYSQKELIGRSLYDLVSPEEEQVLRGQNKQRYQGQTSRYELSFTCKDGKVKRTLITAAPIYSSAGKFTGSMGVVTDISELKKKEEELRQSEEKHRVLINSIRTPVLALDEAMNILYCNHSFARLVGKKTGDLEGDELLKAAPQFKRTASYKAYKECLQTGKSQEVQGEFGDRFFSSHVYRTPWGILSIAEDITERKKAEETLKEREELYRTLVDTAQEAIILGDPSDNIIFANPAAAQLLGYKPEKLVGGSLFDFVPEDEKETLRSQTRKRSEGETTTYELTLKSKNRSLHRVLVRAAPLYDSKGKFYATLGVFTDITERKKAEDALKESEKRFRGVFENVLIGVYRTTPEGRILMANPALINMLGYEDYEELASVNLEREGYGTGYRRSEFIEKIEKDGEIVGVEAALTRKDESPIIVRESARAVRDEKGKTLYYEGTLEDITELSALNEVSRAISATLDLSELYDIIHQQLKRLMNAENFYIALYNKQTDEVTFPYAFDEGKLKPWPPRRGGKGMTEYVIRTGEGQLFQGDNKEEANKRGAELIGPASHSWLGVPMIIRGEVIGVMTVQSYDPEVIYTDKHKGILQTVANQAAQAVQNARAYTELERKLTELSVFNELNRALTSTIEMTELTEVLYEQTSRVMDTESFYVALYDEKGNTLEFPLFVVDESKRIDVPTKPFVKGFTEHVVTNRKSLLIKGNILETAKQLGIQAGKKDGVIPQCWLGVPMIYQDKVIGVIGVQSTQSPERYDEDNQRILEAIARQAAGAVANARAYSELEKRLIELSVLNEIGIALGSVLELDELLEVIYQQTGRVMDTEEFYIALYDERSDTVEFPLTLEKGRRVQIPSRQFENSVSEYVISTRKPLLIRHDLRKVLKDKGVEIVLEEGESEPLCWLGVPMISHDKVVGVMAVQSIDKEGVFDADDERILATIASQAAGAVANARAYKELERRLTELSVFNEISQALSSTIKLDELMKVVYDQTNRLMYAENFYVASFDEETRLIEFPYYIDRGKPKDVPARLFKEGLTEYVISSRKPLLIQHEDFAAESKRLGISMVIHGDAPQSWLGVPMISHERVLGIIAVQCTTEANVYTESDKNLLSSIANQAAGAFANARAYQKLTEQLTERSVINEVSRAISSILDIDELYGVIHKQLERLMNADNFYIALYDKELDEVSFPYVVDGGKKQLSGKGEWVPRRGGTGLTEYVIHSAESHLEQGLDKESSREGFDLIGKPSRSWLGVPMIIRNEVMGVMAVQSYASEIRYSEKHAGVLQMVANQAGQAVENARAYQALEQKLTEVSVFNEISQALSSTIKLDELMEVLYNQTNRLMFAENFFIVSYNEETGFIEFLLFIEKGKRKEMPGRKFGKGLTEYVIKSKKPLLLSGEDEEELKRLRITKVRHGDEAALSWLGVPLISQDRAMGVIAVQSTTKTNVYNEDDKRLLSSIANQAAGAFANARAYAELEERLTELSVFNEVSRALGATLQLDELMEVLLTQTSRVMDTESFYIALHDEETHMVEFPLFKASDGTRERIPPRPFGNGLTEYVITSRKSVFFEKDVIKSAKKLGIDVKVVVNEAVPRSWLGVPMVFRDKVVGVIAVQSTKKTHQYNSDHQRILEAIANQAAGAVVNARSFQQVEQQLTERSVINEISRAISSTLDATEIYGVIHDQLKRLLNADNFYIALYDKESDEVSFPYAYQDGELQEWGGRRAGKGMTEFVIKTGKPQLFQKGSEEEAEKRGVEHIGKASHSWLGVPMVLRGQVLGVMTVQSFDPEVTYGKRHIELMQMVASQAVQAVENARAYAQLERRLTELSVINEIGRAVSSTPKLDELMEVIYSQTSRVMVTDNLYIALYDLASKRVEFPLSLEDGKKVEWPSRPLGNALTDHIINNRKSLLINKDVEKVTKQLGIEMVVIGATPKSWLGVPMISQDEVVGVISVQSTREADVYDEDHQRLLESIANQAAGAVANARAYQALECRGEELRALLTTGNAVSVILDENEVGRITAEKATELIGADGCTVYYFDKEAGELIPQTTTVKEDRKQILTHRIGVGVGVTGSCAERREAIIANNIHLNPEAARIPDTPELPTCLLAAPLMSRDELLGVMVLARFSERKFTEHDLELFILFAQQVANAATNSRLFSRLRELNDNLEKRSEELAALFNTSTELSSTLDEEEVARLISERAGSMIPSSGCTFYKYDKENESLVPLATTVREEYEQRMAYKVPVGEGITGKAASERRPILANNVHFDPKAPRVPGTEERPTCLISVPLVARGELLGGLTIIRMTEEGFEEHDLQIATLFARQAAEAFANSALFGQLLELNEDLKRRSGEMKALLQTSSAVSSVLDEEELVGLIVDSATDLIKATRCTVYRFDTDTNELIPQTTNAAEAEDREKILSCRVPLGKGVTGKTAEKKKPILANNVHLDPDAPRIPGTQERPTCLLSAPLMSRGELLGVMTLTRLSEEEFTDHDLELFTLFARQVADAAANSRLFRRLREFTETLERKVADRTSEVARAKEELETVHGQYKEKVADRLSRIAPVMEKVSIGDFSENIPLPEEEDEFTELLVGLNLMIDDLRFMFEENRRRSEELRELNEGLEKIVAQRTAELKESSRKTAAFARELEEVIYVTSHDLKTPLRAISGFSQFLYEDYRDKLDQEGKLYLTRLIDAVKRMDKLLDDLLQISAITRTEKSYMPVPSAELVKEAIKMVEVDENTDIIYDPEKLPTVLCDRVKMVEVFYNLISNGVKFNDKSHKQIKITSTSSEGFHEFLVEDNGLGIERRHYERIFKIFQRLHARGTYEGTGVGLSMVKRVIEEHNGRIWVESQVGVGTIFHFTLPERVEEDKEEAIPERSG